MTRPPRTSKRVQRKPATQSFSANRLSIGLIPTLIGTSARTSLIEPAVPSTRSVLSPGETATPLRLAFAHPLGRGRNPIRLRSHKNLPHGANSADRGRSGAGLGDITRRRSPFGLGPAGSDRQAQFKFTRRRSTICHYGRPRPPSFGLSGPFVSSHRTRVRKASQRFVSLKAFNTEETNQRFRQRSAKVPSSNQWIITQPTPCLLRLRASKGVLSRENVNSSAVSGNTMRGAARISGARARVSCRPRLRAHPRLRYRRSQPCAMRSPFPANARQRAVLRRALP